VLTATMRKYQKSAARLAARLESDLPEELTVFFDFPLAHQRRLRTANGRERLNREVRRRSRVPVLFPNVASCECLVTAVLRETAED
jgi:putative transposase